MITKEKLDKRRKNLKIFKQKVSEEAKKNYKRRIQSEEYAKQHIKRRLTRT